MGKRSQRRDTAITIATTLAVVGAVVSVIALVGESSPADRAASQRFKLVTGSRPAGIVHLDRCRVTQGCAFDLANGDAHVAYGWIPFAIRELKEARPHWPNGWLGAGAYRTESFAEFETISGALTGVAANSVVVVAYSPAGTADAAKEAAEARRREESNAEKLRWLDRGGPAQPSAPSPAKR